MGRRTQRSFVRVVCGAQNAERSRPHACVVGRSRRTAVDLARAAAFFVALALVGCASAPPTPPAAQDVASAPYAGMKEVPGVRGTLFVRPDHHIGSYDGFLLQPTELAYRSGEKKLTDRQAQALGTRVREIVLDGIAQSDLIRATEPDECILTFRLDILDLERTDVGKRHETSTGFLNTSGGAVLVFEIADSVSGNVIIRYGQRRTFPGGKLLKAGELSSRGLEQRIGEAIVDMGEAMRNVVPRTERLREGTSCVGRIGRLYGIDASGASNL